MSYYEKIKNEKKRRKKYIDLRFDDLCIESYREWLIIHRITDKGWAEDQLTGDEVLSLISHKNDWEAICDEIGNRVFSVSDGPDDADDIEIMIDRYCWMMSWKEIAEVLQMSSKDLIHRHDELVKAIKNDEAYEFDDERLKG